MQSVFVSFHNFNAKHLIEAGQEKLMLEKLFGVPDTFGFHCCQVGGRDGGCGCRDDTDSTDVDRFGLAHLGEGIVNAEVVVVDGLSLLLYQF